MSEKLFPCPFCGIGVPKLYKPTCGKHTPYNPSDRAYPLVRCLGCGVSVEGKDWDDAGKSAVDRWNCRAALAAAPAQGFDPADMASASAQGFRDGEASAAQRVAEMELEVRQLTVQIAGLRAAAEAVVERWDSPHWKDAEPTAQSIAILRAALAGTAQPSQEYADWVSVTYRLPEPGLPVLLDAGGKFPIRAMWAAKHTVPAGDDDTDWAEYVEADDVYYSPEGWYEWNHHEETHWAISTTPLAWMALPATTHKWP